MTTTPDTTISADEDRELVSRVSGGDSAALARLVDKYERKVWRLAIRMVGNPHDADDVVQETFIQVMRKLSTFKGDAAFGTWLFRVASNESLMLLRKRVRTEKRSESIEVVDTPQMPPRGADWSGNPAASVVRSETKDRMHTAIAALPESLRVTFLLRDVEGFSAAEVAEILEVSVPAVKSRLHRARLTLREALSDYFGRPG